MYTSRGYRRASKENKKYSRQGQIIQKKPEFQIDNNPVVLDAYKRYLMGGEILLRPIKLTDSFNCTLSEFNLTWTSSTMITQIQTKLKNFANDIFTRMQSLNRYPISLELKYPELEESSAWWVSKLTSNSRIAGVYDIIIIDRFGNVSYKQFGSGYLLYSNAWTSGNEDNLTLAYGAQSGDPPSISFGNPSQMVVDISYFPFFS